MSTTNRLAVVAGSFDPFTNGHLDLVERAARLFDRVVVAVLVNKSKQAVFTTEERVGMIRDVVGAMPGVEVDTFDGLLVDYVRKRAAVAVVRGLRTAGEFTDEWPTALVNRQLNAACETVFVIPAAGVMHVSSRHVREVASFGGPIDAFVPAPIVARVARKFRP